MKFENITAEFAGHDIDYYWNQNINRILKPVFEEGYDFEALIQELDKREKMTDASILLEGEFIYYRPIEFGHSRNKGGKFEPLTVKSPKYAILSDMQKKTFLPIIIPEVFFADNVLLRVSTQSVFMVGKDLTYSAQTQENQGVLIVSPCLIYDEKCRKKYRCPMLDAYAVVDTLPYTIIPDNSIEGKLH